jgi:hypothetical protein
VNAHPEPTSATNGTAKDVISGEVCLLYGPRVADQDDTIEFSAQGHHQLQVTDEAHCIE